MNPDLTALYKKQYETLTDRLTKMDSMREATTPEAMKRVSVANRVELENPMTRIESGMNIGNVNSSSQIQSMQLQMDALNNLRDQLLAESQTSGADTLSQSDLQSEYLKGNKRIKYDQENGKFLIDTEGGESNDVKTWAKSIKDGLITIKDVPETDRMAVLQELSGTGFKSEEQQKAIDSKGETVSLVDDILGRDLRAVTGKLQIGAAIPGTEAKTTAAKVDQLKSQLSLEKRTLLKGSGQISDYESKILEKSIGALDRNMSEEDFRVELERIREALSGSQSKVEKPNNNTLTDIGNFFLGGAKNTIQDIVAGATAGNKGRQEALAKADAVATQLEEQAMATNDMQKRMEALKRANEIRQSISQTAGEMSSKFSKDINKDYLSRGVEAGSQIAGTAGLAGGIANKVLPTSPLTKPLGPLAGKASLTDTASKGVDKVKEFVKSKDGFNAAVEKAGKLNTKSVIEAGEKYVKNDPFAKEAWKEIKPSLGTKTSARELLDKMWDVWSGAYDKSGDVRSKANAALYNKLYGAARKVIADQAPEVSKKIAWSRFINHQLPKIAQKTSTIGAKIGLTRLALPF